MSSDPRKTQGEQKIEREKKKGRMLSEGKSKLRETPR
jgi:hypothetical protein